MSASTTGILVGAILALTLIAFNFGAMLIVALFIAIGYGVGRVIEGKLDLRSVSDALRGRRTS